MSLSVLALSVLALSVLAPLAHAAPPAHAANNRAKVDVCHVDGDGVAHVISVSENAVAAHEGHGDVLPGAYYPDIDGDGFGDADAPAQPCPGAGLVDNADDCGDGGAASGPGVAEIEDGIDNDCDGDIDEGFVCPCYDAGDLDALLADPLTYALGWAVRADGLTDVTSLRGYTWAYNGADAQWQSPTVGADLYDDGGVATCEVWSETWLAAPDHAWAGDAVSVAQPVPDASVAVCQGLLDDWIVDQAVPFTQH